MTQSTRSNTLHDLGYKIFLDRYALKDMTRETLAVGDTVVALVDPDTRQLLCCLAEGRDPLAAGHQRNRCGRTYRPGSIIS